MERGKSILNEYADEFKHKRLKSSKAKRHSFKQTLKQVWEEEYPGEFETFEKFKSR